MLTIRGGWPTRIEHGAAVYVKRNGARFTRAERHVYNWLTLETGRMPYVEYFDSHGNRTMFGSLQRFDKAHPTVSRRSAAQKKAWQDPETRKKRTAWWASSAHRK